MPISILITPLDILWKLLEFHGCDPLPVFANENVSASNIKQTGKRVPIDVMDRLWEKAAQTIDDPSFGLQAYRFWHPSHLNALGYGWLASHTLRDALKLLERYWLIVAEGGSITIRDGHAGLNIIYRDRLSFREGAARVDVILSCIMHMCRLNYGMDLSPVSVCLARPLPARDLRLKYKDYYRTQVTFESNRNSITFPMDVVDKKLIGSNPDLTNLNEQAMNKYLNSLWENDIIYKVQNAIVSGLTSEGILKEIVALQLNISARSLQRELKKQGTSFSLLLDNTRKKLAKNYLLNTEHDLAEISLLLGFSEASSFSRAFKRWTKTTPKKFRMG